LAASVTDRALHHTLHSYTVGNQRVTPALSPQLPRVDRCRLDVAQSERTLAVGGEQ
jgi:hypothetical protein